MKSFFIVYFWVLMLAGCAIPCDWALPDEICYPVDMDADVIGDSGVSVLEVPPEYQQCPQNLVPTFTQICEHTGGEPTKVCSSPPPLSSQPPSCAVVNDPLQFQVKECLAKDVNGSPTTVILCDKCTQDLSKINGVEDLPAALKPAPLCRNPRVKDGIPYPSKFCGAKPALNVNYCTQNVMPQKCPLPHKWMALQVCDGMHWVHVCACKD